MLLQETFEDLDYSVCRHHEDSATNDDQVDEATWMTFEDNKQLKDNLYTAVDSGLLHVEADEDCKDASSILEMRAAVKMLAED